MFTKLLVLPSKGNISNVDGATCFLSFAESHLILLPTYLQKQIVQAHEVQYL
jgi:hypothetical protein